ncbi:MAG: flagellar FlbD family protein [Nitriliruptor sp.]
MILVHRLKGEPIFINADMIQSIEARPDTVVVLIDGRTFVLSDEPAQIVDRVRQFRASVLVAADELREDPARVPLTVVSDREH